MDRLAWALGRVLWVREGRSPMSEPTARTLLERAFAWMEDEWPGSSIVGDIRAYLAAPPAQPPRVTAEMVREADHSAELSNGAWTPRLEAHYERMAARLSAEREPATNPASISSPLGVVRDPGEAEEPKPHDYEEGCLICGYDYNTCQEKYGAERGGVET